MHKHPTVKKFRIHHETGKEDKVFVAVEEIGSTPNPAQANIGEPEPATHRENKLRDKDAR
jgi:hypothetical protein